MGTMRVPREERQHPGKRERAAQHHLPLVGLPDLGDAFQVGVRKLVHPRRVASLNHQDHAARGGVIRAEAGHNALVDRQQWLDLLGRLGLWQRQSHQNIAIGFTGDPVVL